MCGELRPRNCEESKPESADQSPPSAATERSRLRASPLFRGRGRTEGVDIAAQSETKSRGRSGRVKDAGQWERAGAGSCARRGAPRREKKEGSGSGSVCYQVAEVEAGGGASSRYWAEGRLGFWFSLGLAGIETSQSTDKGLLTF